MTRLPLRWPRERATVMAFRDGYPDPSVPTVQVPATLGILAWLAEDEMIAAREAEIDAQADDAAAVASDERATRTTDLLAAILEVEREEEALIEEAGGDILRRPDADPRAVLGLSGDLPAPRE